MSCCGSTKDFCVGAGATFEAVTRWGSSIISSKPITGISSAAPAVVTAPSHGLPTEWPVAVVSARGMVEINSENYPPRGSDWHRGLALTANTVELNDVNTASYSEYTTGGFLVYPTPVSLVGATGVVIVRESPGGEVLLTSELGGDITLTLDNTAKTITFSFDTAGLTWTTGYYDLEVTDSSGKVTQLLAGVINIQ